MIRLPASQHNSGDQQRKRFRGQTLVEFALVLPILLLILFVIIELARLLHAWLAVENGARFGVRYAVTGEFDDTYCSGYPGGVCDDLPEQEAARIPSIVDASESGAVAILRDPTAGQGTSGFFKVTVCSNKMQSGSALFSYHASITPSHIPAWCEELATHNPIQDPGGPGDRVSVTVDFEHPLIVPILSTWLPHIHLSARREGIVEQFRVARVVGLPATISVPTFTPTNTATATATATITDTPLPTATLCKVPPVVTITAPTNGAFLINKVPGQAVAWDPDNADPAACVGAGIDGEGIVQVDFAIDEWTGLSWNRVYTHTEFAEAYCAFGGNAPCSEHPTTSATWPSGSPMGSGLHRMQAVATDDEGIQSPVAEVTFTLNVPDTPTPTSTSTPTATATVDCTNLSVGSYFTSGNGLYMWMYNGNPRTIFLTGSNTNWNEMSAGMFVNQLQFNWTPYYSGDDYSSSTTEGPAVPASFPQGPGSWTYWYADFGGVPGGQLFGNYSTTLTFDNSCNISAALFVATPTVTPTFTQTPTPTRTPTITQTPIPTNTSTVTRTPTITLTPTPTNTPSCSGVTFGGTDFTTSSSRLRLYVNNTTYPGLRITGISIDWGPLNTASTLYGWNEYVDYVQWDGSTVYGGNDYTSATGFGLNSAVNIGSNNIFIDFDGGYEGDLRSYPLNLSSNNFGFTLQFSDTACNLSRSAQPKSFPPPTSTPLPTSTPTATPTPTNTFVPTRTNTPLPTRTPTETGIPDTATPTATVDFD
ncbi:MAG: TadE/TadG family type IV pilus assembly protein [Anaerolineales bacterium]|jgi:hypothetical protein